MSRKITLSDIREIFKEKTNNKSIHRTDSHCYGVVHSVNEDGSYNVILGGGNVDDPNAPTVKCQRMVGAEEHDVVLVLILANGYAVVQANLGGDSDLQESLAHFWYDNQGAHIVSDTSGYRTDLDGNAMRIGINNSVVSEITDKTMCLGKNNATSEIDLCKGSAVIRGSATNFALFRPCAFSSSTQPTEAQFNSNKTLYWVKPDPNVENYERCLSTDSYNSQTTYYKTLYAYDPEGDPYLEMKDTGDVRIGGHTVEVYAYHGMTVNGRDAIAGDMSISNGWDVIKYSDGRMEAWYKATNSTTISFTSVTGGGRCTLNDKTLPSGFSAAPKVFASASSNVGAWLSLNPTDITTTKFTPRLARLFSNASLSAGQLTMQYYAVGEW